MLKILAEEPTQEMIEAGRFAVLKHHEPLVETLWKDMYAKAPPVMPGAFKGLVENAVREGRALGLEEAAEMAERSEREGKEDLLALARAIRAAIE